MPLFTPAIVSVKEPASYESVEFLERLGDWKSDCYKQCL